MKRRTFLASVASVAVALTGCSSTPATTPGASSSASGPADGGNGNKTKVAFVSQIEGIPYFNGFKTGAEKAAKDLGVSYTQAGPARTDSAEQVRIFEGLISQGYAAISVSPLDPSSINNSIQKAVDHGIKVATSDADAPDSAREVFVSQASDAGLGAAAMDEIGKAAGGEGQFAIVSGGADTATFNNWIAAIKARQTANWPKMKLVGGVQYTTDTADALQKAQNLMTAFPDLKGIIAVPSTAVPGVAQAVQNANAIGKVAVTGFGSPNTAGPYLKSGAMISTVLWDVNALGYLTVWAMVQEIKGIPFKKTNTVAGIDNPVTYDSAKKILLLGEPKIFTKNNYKNYNF